MQARLLKSSLLKRFDLGIENGKTEFVFPLANPRMGFGDGPLVTFLAKLNQLQRDLVNSLDLN
jgi:hypothetical protein